MKDVLRTVDRDFDAFKERLIELVRIPSVSAEGFPADEVRRSAEAFAGLLREIGLANVEVLEIDGVHPYVYGDWLGAPGAPTLILYGHHDVVPPGRPDQWRTPAFAPAERGGRLYGRGASDDKGGILVHIAAVAAYLRTRGALPCNVKFVIEGEEEIGSGHLAAIPRTVRGEAGRGRRRPLRHVELRHRRPRASRTGCAGCARWTWRSAAWSGRCTAARRAAPCPTLRRSSAA